MTDLKSIQRLNIACFAIFLGSGTDNIGNISRTVSYYNPSVVDSIRPDIHRLSADLLAERHNWGSAEREDFKKPKTLENLKDNKDPSGVYLGEELQLGKA